MMVQLGYNGAGRALLFLPELVSGALTVPETGSLVDDAVLPKLSALAVAERRGAGGGGGGGDGDLSLPRGIVVH